MRYLLIAILAIWLAGPARAAEKVALIIGNNSYENFSAEGQLVTAVNDAETMAETLSGMGFEVTVVTNGKRFEMLRALKSFEDSLTPKSKALVFYAGHGVEVGGANYLLPSDTPRLSLSEKYLVGAASIPLNDVLAAIQRAQAGIVILDACRNDPFEEAAARERSVRGGITGTINRGLAGLSSEPRGTFIVYSAGVKQQALDRLSERDPNPNSVFTRVFVEEMSVPGRSIREVVVKTRSRVRQLALTAQPNPHQQFPAYYDQLTEDLILVPKADSDPVADAFAAAFRSGAGEELARLARAYPDHPQAELARATAIRLRTEALDREVSEALRTLDRGALERALRRAPDHPRATELAAALEQHSEIDREVNRLDLATLETLFSGLHSHPRREEVRIAIRRAIARQTCSKLLAYGFRCPNEMQALSSVPPADPAGSAEEAPDPVPGSGSGTRVVREEGTVPEAPADPFDAFLEDAGAAALAKAVEIPLDYLQTALSALGHYRHAVDGAAGPRTNRAIARWRKAHGRGETGALSARERVVLMKQAASESAAARAYLGVMYGLGLGVSLDPSKSRELLEGAAGDGFSDARAYLENLSKTWN